MTSEVRQQEEKEKTIPLYIGYLTFVSFVDWLKAMPTIPSQIDRSLWAPKFSGSNGAQLIVGLKFLKLLADNKPTPHLVELVKADNERRQELIRQILRDAYGSEWVDNLGAKTPKMLDDRLKELGTTDATHRKAISFFINACKRNGVLVPPAIGKRARIRPSKLKGQKKPGPSLKSSLKGDSEPTGKPVKGAEKGAVQSIALESGGTVSLEVSVDLFNLSTDDRAWVFKLIDMLKAYGSEQKI